MAGSAPAKICWLASLCLGDQRRANAATVSIVQRRSDALGIRSGNATNVRPHRGQRPQTHQERAGGHMCWQDPRIGFKTNKALTSTGFVAAVTPIGVWKRGRVGKAKRAHPTSDPSRSKSALDDGTLATRRIPALQW